MSMSHLCTGSLCSLRTLRSDPSKLRVSEVMAITLVEFAHWIQHMEEEEEKFKDSKDTFVVRLLDLGSSFSKFSYREFHKWLGTCASTAVTSLFMKDHNFLNGVLGTRVDLGEFIKRGSVVAEQIVFPKGFQLDHFVDTFLKKTDDVQAVFPSGKCDLRMVCLLVKVLPFVRGVVDQEEKLRKAMDSKSFAGEMELNLKNGSDHNEFKGLHSSRALLFSEALDSMSEVLKNFATSKAVLEVAKCADQHALGRCKDLAQICGDKVVNVLKKMIEEISQEASRPCDLLVEHVAKQKKSAPVLYKMMERNQACRATGNFQERLDGNPSLFFKVMEEGMCDIFYMATNRILVVCGLLDTCMSKIGNALAHPALGDVEALPSLKQNVQSFNTNLVAGPFIEIKMVLADLIVSCLPISFFKVGPPL